MMQLVKLLVYSKNVVQCKAQLNVCTLFFLFYFLFYVRELLRDEPLETVGLKYTGRRCGSGGSRGRCR